jgi:hypothetical protein
MLKFGGGVKWTAYFVMDFPPGWPTIKIVLTEQLIFNDVSTEFKEEK